MLNKILLILAFASSFLLAQPIIPNGGTVSSVYDLGVAYVNNVEVNNKLISFTIPSSFDGTTIKVYTCNTENGTFYTARPSDSDADISISVTAGETYFPVIQDFYWLQRYIYFESDVSATGADTLGVDKKGTYTNQ